MSMIYAHRGLHGAERGHIENSTDALVAAEGMGIGIETDVRLTGDGVPVLFHNRTILGSAVSDITYKLLCKAAGYPVATLDWLLGETWAVDVNLEIKTLAAYDVFAERMAAMPENQRVFDGLVSSFDHRVVELARKAGQRCAMLFANAPAVEDSLPPTRENCSTVVLDFNIVNLDAVSAWRKAGYRVVVYGPKTIGEHHWLMNMSVGIITDHPEMTA